MKDKGFRQIDNEFFLAIMVADLTRAGTKVLLAVIHFTLGYDQRDTAEISLTTFQTLTKLSRAAVRTAIKELIAYGLITVVTPATNRIGAIYRINKDWRPEGKPAIPLEGKPTIPPEISEGSKTIPPDAENYTSRGIVPTPTTPLLKKERKPLKKTPKGVRNKRSTPQPVLDIFDEMKAHLGYPGKTDKDPIPNYAKEGQFIKRMLTRGFTRADILACWKGKVDDRGGDFVSMTWVNEDIGKKGGHGAPRQSSRQLPTHYRTPEEIFGDSPTTQELKDSIGRPLD